MRCHHLLLAIAMFTLSARADIVVFDDAKLPVRLSAPATRILTLSPHATEMLVAIGAEKKIVAAAQFFDYPETLHQTPKINSFGSLDREAILIFQPDLVIAWASGNRPADIQWLKDAHIPVFLSEPKTLADIADNLEKIGMLTGRNTIAKQAAQTFMQRINHACPHRKNSDFASVYYEVWHAPAMTIGGKHWLNEILQLAHLKNIFSSVARGSFTVATEELLARSPQYIITSQPQAPRQIHTAKILLASPELGRPGPRIVEGIEALCDQL